MKFVLEVYQSIKAKLKAGISTWNHSTSYYLQLLKLKKLAAKSKIEFKTTGHTLITFYAK